MFLAELKSISIMNTGLSGRRSGGRPEDGELRGGPIEEDEDMKALFRETHLRGYFSASST